MILPFHGSRAEGLEALEELGRLHTRRADERILVDNTEDAVMADAGSAGVQVVVCPVKRSAYAARNVGAERSRAPWLLFVDADCRLPADLLDCYLEVEPGERTGALAGTVSGAEQGGLIPAYIRSRRHLDQVVLFEHRYRPMAVTANLLVRRAAFEAIGGFAEQTLSGADADFCWRLQDAGWSLELLQAAAVEHVHRQTLRALLSQAQRDGRGGTWLARRHRGYPRRVELSKGLGRAVAGVLAWTVLARPRRALFKAIDGIWIVADNVGALRGNAPPAAPPAPGSTVLVSKSTPTLDLTELRGAPEDARLEAAQRPSRPAWRAVRLRDLRYWEDDGPLQRLWDLIWMTTHRPRAVARDAAFARRCADGISTWELVAPARRLAESHGHVLLLDATDSLGPRLAKLAGAATNSL